jgi:hypothetical protein
MDMSTTKHLYLIEWYEIDAQGVYRLCRKITGNTSSYIFRHECGAIVLRSIEPIANHGYDPDYGECDHA